MRALALLAAVFISSAWAQDEPVASCRAAHDGDMPALVACLEAALARCSPTAPRNDTPADSPTGLGAEQVLALKAQQEPPRAPQVVRIVAASYDARGLGTFQMEGGQVWRETTTSPEHRRLKSGKAYSARIEPGKVSGYRMYVDGIRRMMTVERIE